MQVKRSLSSIYKISILLLLFTAGALGLWAHQAKAQTSTVLASGDTFVDLNRATTNLDSQRLELTYSNFPSFNSSGFGLLQFDLSAVTDAADQSQLVVELVENSLPPGDTVDVGLYAVADDSWTETGVTFNTSPTVGSLLQTISVSTGFTGTMMFDNSAVGSYIEQERTGDGLASFVLRIDSGTALFGGIIVFEDREGIHDGVNGNEPFIQLPVVAALDCQWTGAVDTDWFTTGNWSNCQGVGDEPPSPTDNAIISGFLSNNPVLNADTTIAGLTLNSGALLTVGSGATLTVNGPVDHLFGTLTGDGDLIANGIFTWGGGTQSGAGTTIAQGGLVLEENFGKTLDGRTLDNAGAAVWTDFGGVAFFNGAVFNNLSGATLDVQNDASLTGSAGTFNNAGAFTKSSGGSSFAATSVQVPFNNSGTVNVQAGTLSLQDGGASSSGAFDVASGAILDFNHFSDIYTVDSGSSINSAGEVDFSGGTVEVLGSYSSTGLTRISGATANFDTGSNVSIPTLIQSGGVFSSATNLTVTGVFTWGGGTQSGVGTTIAQSGLVLENFGKTLDGRTLNNVGAAVWTDFGGIFFSNGAVINNLSGATLDVQNDAALSNFGGGTFNNAGAFTKSAGTGATSVQVVFNNSGAVDVQAGILSLQSGGASSSGAFDVASGAILDFNHFSDIYTVDSGSSINSAGEVDFSGGTVEVLGSYSSTGLTRISGATANFDTGSNVSIPTLIQSGGVFSSATNLTVTGVFTWGGGTQSGAGTTIAQGGLVLENFGKTLDGRTLNNVGAAVWTDFGGIFFSNGAVINNLSGATLDVQNDAALSNFGGGTFNNAGAFTKSAGTGATSVQVVFNNSGAVDVQAGILSLQSGGASSSGAFDVASGAILDFNHFSDIYTVDSGSSINSAGEVDFSGGTVEVLGSYSSTGLTRISGATANFDTVVSNSLQELIITNGSGVFRTGADLTAGSLLQSGGVFSSATNLTVTGVFTWGGGTQSGVGTTIAQSGLVLENFGKTLDSRTLNNVGAAVWTDFGSIFFSNGAVFNNLSGATLDVQNDAALSNFGGGTFNNAGAFTKSAGGSFAATSVQVPFNNSGAVDVQAGTLSLQGGGASSSGAFDVASGAILDFNHFSDIYTVDSGSSINSAGEVDFSGGTVDVLGSYSSSGLTRISGATANFDTVVSNSLQEFIITNGSGVFRTGVNLTAGSLLQSGGVFSSATNLTVTGVFTWGGGTQSGAGTTIAQGSLVLESFSSKTLDSRTLDNAATGIWTDSGSIFFSNGAVFNNLSGATLDVQNDITGLFGSGTFNNAGAFTKSAGTGPTFVSIPFNNSGTVDIQTGILGVDGGFVQTAGVTRLNGGTLGNSSNQTVDIQNGILEGIGTINASVTNAGQVSPGLASTGVMTITGDYTQQSGGLLTMELGGPTPGIDHDQLKVGTVFGSSANLDGTLDVSLTGGFDPGAGSSFEILTFNSRTGDFAFFTGANIGSGKTLVRNYTPSSLFLVVDVILEANLSVTKVATPDPAFAGRTLSYQMTINNAGPADASNLILTDTLPAGVTFLSATPSQGNPCSEAAGIVTCTLGSLAPAGSATVDIDVTAPPVTGTISNLVEVSADEFDPVPGNNTATLDTDVIPPQANLVVSKSASPGSVPVGGSLTYLISARNFGPVDATNVVVTDTLPVSVTFVSASASCSHVSGVVTCDLGDLPLTSPIATASIDVTAPPTAGIVTNQVEVVSAEEDPFPSNNTFVLNTIIFDTDADLRILKSATPSPVVAGELLTYTLNIANLGPLADATNVVVTDTLPAAVTFVSATPSQGTCGQTGDDVICNLGDLIGFSGANVQIVVTAPVVAGTITNQAQVSADQNDPNLSNNSATEDTTVNPLPTADLQVSKTDSPDPVTVVSDVTYTIDVTNNGPDAADNVVLTDTLPSGVSFVSVLPSAECSEAGGIVTCNLNTLSSANSRIVTIVVTANSIGILTNSASVTSTTADPDVTNNSATEDTTVNPLPSADLQVSKTDSSDPVTVGSDVTYTIDVTNSGPDAADNVVLTDTLPSGVSFVSATTGCSQASGLVTCALGTLANGGSSTVDIVVTANSIGILTNSASVTSTTADPDVTNNSATEDTTVNPLPSADLQVSKTDSSDPVTVGSDVTYTIDVTNNGPDAADNVVLTDTLPSGVSFVSATTGCSQASGLVTCALGTLANGGSSTVDIVVTANSIGILTNSASVTSTTADPDVTNNSATEDTTVNPLPTADLQVSKTDSPDPVTVGSDVTYTINVTNNGPDAADNVVLTDTLPSGVSFVSATTGCSQASGLVTCALGTLANGGSSTVDIVVTANSIGILTNSASVTSTTADPNATNNSATEDTTVNPLPTADLQVSKTDSPDPVTVGSDVTYTIDVTNNGPDAADNVVLTDTLPSGVSFVSATSGCSQASGLVTCNLGTLANGGSSTVDIVVTANSIGILTNSADVASTTADPDVTNNSATEDTTVNPLPTADLQVSKTDSPDPVTVGSDVTYTIDVTNNGPDAADNVVLTDTLPAGVSFVSATSGCSQASGLVTCNLGTLANGGSSTVAIVVTANSIGILTNSADVASTTADPDVTNNSATEDTTVNPLPTADLQVSKTDSPDPVTVGSDVTYTIDVTNNGPDAADNVVLTDTLPSGVSFVSATSGCSQASGLVTCNLGTLANGGSSTVAIVVTANSIGILTNSADVASTTADPDVTNNSATEDTTVNPLPTADLQVSKTDSPDPVTVGSDVTYTIDVTNNGPDAADNVILTDTLPAGVSFISATTGCSQASGLVTCALGTLANGGSSTVDIVVTANSIGILTNSADVASTTADPNATNNSATEDTTVNPLPTADLQVSKTDSPDPVTVGSDVTYTIQVSNNGPDAADNVVLTDTLPAGVSFVSVLPSAECSESGGIVTCNLNTLSSANSRIVTIVVTANSVGTLTNSASVTSTTADPNATNNSASVDTTVDPLPTADLQVSKTDSPDPVTVGSDVTYTIQVSNNGPDAADNVVLTDTLPAGVSFVSATTGCSQASGLVTCNLGTLANGGSSTVDIVVTANSVGILTNSADVASTTADPDVTNNSASEDTTVDPLPTADLQVSKTDSPDPVTVGSDVTYTIQVSNNGPDAADNVVLTDTLPAGVSFVSATTGCSQASGLVTCNLGTLANGGSSTVDIVVTANSIGILTNSASVTSTTADPDATNNSASVDTTINPLPTADLQVSKIDSPDPVTVGSDVTYTIQVSNNGPDAADNVVLTDTLPAGVSFISATTGCSQASGIVTCALGTLANGGSSTVDIVVTANSIGILTNSADVASTTADPNATNNSAIEDTTVNPLPSADLQVSKTDSPDPVTVGSDVTYTIDVTNNGPDAADNVVLTDTLPAGVSFVSATTGCSQASGLVTCALGTLANGGSSTVDIVVTANSIGILTNSADVASTTADPDVTNNSATEDTTVNPLPTADLQVSKTDSPDPVTVGSDVTYTIQVSNNGPDAADNVVLTDTLPAGVSFVSATSGCSQASGLVTCNLGTLANGGSSTVAIVVTADSVGILTNSASVTSTTADPDATNNSATEDTTVNPLPTADLQVSKTDSPDPVTVGSDVTYTIDVTNNGPDAADNVVLTDTLPAGVSFVSATTGCSQASGLVTCALGTLANGGSSTVDIVVTANSIGILTNSADVASTTADPDVTNNSATEDTTVNPLPTADLQVSKTDSPDPVTVGSDVTYTIQVSNNGPDAADNVVLTDTLPAGVSFVSATSGCSQASGLVTCNLGTLANGGSSTVAIVVTADSVGILTNSASVTSTTADPDATNNSATEDTTVDPGGAQLINALLSLNQTQTSYNPADGRAPAGVFTLSATFSNQSSTPVADIFFEVTTLTGGNLLLNADGGPAGAGAQLTVPSGLLGSNGIFDPGESFTVDFEIGLAARRGFSFFVDAYGIPGGVTSTSLKLDDEVSSFQFEFQEKQLGGMLYLPIITR